MGLFLTLLGASVASGNTKNEGKTFCRLRMRGFSPVWRKLAVKVYSTSKKSLSNIFFDLKLSKARYFCLFIFPLLSVLLEISQNAHLKYSLK